MTSHESREFDQLVSDAFEGVLSAEAFAELERRVREVPECRTRYLELAAVHAGLAWSHGGTEPTTPAKPVRSTRHVRWAATAVATAAAVVVAWFATRPAAPVPIVSEPEPFARVVEVGGRAEVTAGGREPVEAGEGTPVYLGQVVRTDGGDGFVVLDLGGGSRLELGADARLRVTEGGNGVRLVLSAGLLRGVIGRTVVTVQTSEAEVSPGEGPFVVCASPDVTEVEAEGGTVPLVRTSDGQRLEVPGGSSAVVSAAEPMELRRAARPTTPRAEFKVLAHWGLAFSPDGRTFVARLKTTGWALVDVNTGRQEAHRLPPGEWTTAALSADGGTFAAVSTAGRVQVFTPTTRVERDGFDAGRTGNGVWAISADGSRFASAQSGSVRVWATAGGREVTSTTPDQLPRVVALSADGRLVGWASDGSRKRPGHTLTVWDATAGRVVSTVTVPDRPLHELAFTPDGRRIAGATDHGAVHIWEVETGKWVAGRGTADGWAKPVQSLAFSPDGRVLAAGLSDGRARLWAVGAAADTVCVCGTPPVTSLAFAPNGRTLAAGTNRGSVTLWDVPTE